MFGVRAKPPDIFWYWAWKARFSAWYNSWYLIQNFSRFLIQNWSCIRVEPSTPQHSYSTATAVDFRSLFLKYSTAVKKQLYSNTQHFTAVFRCTQLFPDKSKIKLWKLRKTKIFHTKHYIGNRLSKFGDSDFKYLQKYDRTNSQKIRSP